MFMTLIRRELKTAFRNRAEIVNPLWFFLIVITLFPLGIGPEPQLLARIAPGVVWVAALLASLLSLERLFRDDLLDGSLEQLLLLPTPLAITVAGKVCAHWLVTGLPLLLLSPLLALLLSPFGGFSVCIAAITAAICMGPDVHPDPARRYMAAVAAGGFYLLAGLFGGAIGQLFSALPPALIHTIAGLALLGTLSGSLFRALQEEKERDAAIVTFLITASGLTLFGVGAAFWGLVGGVLVWLLLSRR